MLASPHYHRIVAELRGVAAHAGIRPEAGRSAIVAAARAIAAMPLGRLDEETTANVGTIAGGVGHQRRARALPASRRRCARLDEAKVEALVERDRRPPHRRRERRRVRPRRRPSRGSSTATGSSPRAPQVQAAEAALRACGYAPRHIVTGGGSDANALIAAGFPCVNLANGTEHHHQPDERVSVAALEGMLDVAFALLDDAPDA